MHAQRPLVVCIVGGGPRGTSVLERLVANVDLLEPGRRLEVHLVDPHPPGGGRVWRHDQSPLLWMNSTTADVTTFPDDSVRCEGPVVAGPSLWEWVRDVGRLLPAGSPVGAEARRLGPGSFATRRLQSAYLGWVFERVRASAPERVGIVVHPTHAVDVTPEPGTGRHLVSLHGGSDQLTVDRIVLTQGHLDARPTLEEQRLGSFAERHGLGYLPAAYTADLDLDHIPAGETVLLRGFGLAFVDLMVLLGQGRGGRFERRDGELAYVPSGREPRLVVGSGRGVPYHAKISYELGRPPTPRFFTANVCQQLRAERGPLDFWDDLFPLMWREICWAYYRELFTAHPDRVTMSWDDFAAGYADPDRDDSGLAALVAQAVPKREDRLDLASFDRPLAGRTFVDQQDLRTWLRDYIRADLDRRADPYFSADGAAFLALLVVYGTLATATATGCLSTRAQADIEGWWHGFFSYFASGPPAPRLEELLALSRAGIVDFLGADMVVETDPARGAFVASSASMSHRVTARWLVESRLPRPDVARTTDPLVASLLSRGEAAEHVAIDANGDARPTGRLRARPADLRVVRGDGTPSPDLFAAGYWVAGTAAGGAFPRPRMNAPFFRQNDALAREILRVDFNGPDLAPSPTDKPSGRQGAPCMSTARDRSV
ncbi:FAD/NAD(P)-binding protein [Actinopolymorpha sp. NPDC004070]|uniref:FAD/NAD(P)-binding protein n=1 Tax=Actinopolymorpha sp. NPDC004070 TaxID=3154548 RepID=UPI0033A1F912